MGSCLAHAKKAGFYFFSPESTLCIKVEIQIPFPPFPEYIYEAPDIPRCIVVCGKPPATAEPGISSKSCSTFVAL